MTVATGPLLPIRAPGESAERYLDRLMPALNNALRVIPGTATLYDNSGRLLVSPTGVYSYVGARTVVAPDIVQIDTSDIVDAAIETAKLGDGAVTGAKILDATIGTAKIADAAIVTAKIGDLAVTTAKIDDLAVNNAKIANLSVSKLEAGTIAANGLYVGNDRTEIDGLNGRFTVKDTLGTTRVEMGALSAGGYGLIIKDSAGNAILSSGSTTTINGAFIDQISANIITGGAITITGGATQKAYFSTNGSAYALEAVQESTGGGAGKFRLTNGSATGKAVEATALGSGSALWSSATSGNAVYGETTNAHAVYGSTSSASFAGVYGAGGIGVQGNGSTEGVYGTATSGSTGRGVFGTGRTGVQGTGTLYGVNGTTSTGTAGVYGSGGGYGVQGVASTSSSSYTGVHGTGFHGVWGAGGSYGVVGNGSSWDFFANGAGGNYGPFTGAHDALLPKAETPVPGDIVADTGLVEKSSVSQVVTEVRVATAATGACVGVFVSRSPLDLDDLPVPLADNGTGPAYVTTHDRAIINSLGEGQVNVTGEGGNIAVGDLIVLSSTPGKGMRQADDVIRSSTVAKAREAVTFTSPTEEKQIACIYLCG